ncbi:MAG TPA: FAD-dependent oxidoreductase [Acidimicrobiales bacterium]|nr:FAD-dependent oxidoreductase [Acidimicrobiales bacterium]
MAAVTPLTPDYVARPYWWDEVDLPQAAPVRLPATVDVAVVGGGYTGLAAAWEISRAGRAVIVLDRDDIGAGASSRNGGMVHPGGKRDLSEFLAQPSGRRLWDETVAAFEGIAALSTELGIGFDWQRRGHLELAHHPRVARHQRGLATTYASIGEAARFLDASDVQGEIGSGRFFGGLLVERSAGVHPAKLAAGLVRAAETSGAVLQGATTVLSVQRRAQGYDLETSRGVMRCGEVVVATNGTTDRRLVSWLGRRVLPIGSYMIATEPLDPDLATSVNPHGRMFFDTKNLLHYWRLSPDGRRVLFGGRTSLSPSSVERSRDLLHAAMVKVHPQLEGARVARAWGGQVALTADRFPHLGRHRDSGVVYAMGYCGSGVALSVHFGRVVGRWLCGLGDESVFASRSWPPVPWAAHVPWLLAGAGVGFKVRDVLGR